MGRDNIYNNRSVLNSKVMMIQSYKKDEVFIVIAAYNEEKNIKQVISNLQKNGFKNIVITDDGSRDKTFEIISRSGVYALRHVLNRGQGASLQTGIDYALKKGAKYIVTFDADGQHRVEDLDAMITPVAKGIAEVTLGSRFINKTTEMPILRRLTLKVGVLVQFIFYGVLLSDAHNGFRCFSRKAAEKIRITSDRMEHASQIVEEIKLKNIKYKEVPVTIIYNEETLKKGHGGVIQAIKVLTRMIIRKLLS